MLPVSAELLFRALLGVHVLAGLTSVVSGVVAMVSKKQRGRHPRFGTIYYSALCVIWVTATGMAVLRWTQDAYLFGLGSAAFACASTAYAARRVRWPGWLRYHIIGMGASYVILLTTFYVDNGPRLPLWSLLPHITYWTLPSVIGVPLMWRALRRHRPGHPSVALGGRHGGVL
jgi:hypothetical protein